MTSNILRSHWFTYKRAESKPSTRVFPKILSSYDEIPASFLANFPGGDAGFPYTVLIPADLQENLYPQMFCLYEDQLVTLEAVQGGVKTEEYALSSITSVEHGSVLLHSWMTIYSASRRKTFHFSATDTWLFTPILNAIRGINNEQAPDYSTVRPEEIAKFGYLWKENIKYFNYAKQSLPPNASVLGSVYQGEISLSKLNFFKKPVFSAYLSARLAILTDRELVLIKESEEIRQAHDTSYGGVFSYLSREKIHSVEFETSNDSKIDCVMNIRLLDGKYYQFQFSTATALELDAFKQACAQSFASSPS
ncbi:hypothetical protein CSB45_06895 [candidate division KSB3 bacterium]|uniref:Uncharacterized protein n=1 Tax=candidate division KSB3 bacterium TaxID=2044937 RepID=A0A2G6E635_9BACT|nr:MAG: hypothetical protein CSB45_06895 [candidate division KSB3 bacterium]PIE30038.1 MAG: hypothetical protein CSA57_05700 [candidate division KSB3 bacterium]